MTLDEATDVVIKHHKLKMNVMIGVCMAAAFIRCMIGTKVTLFIIEDFIFYGFVAGLSIYQCFMIIYRVNHGYYLENETESKKLISFAIKIKKANSRLRFK